MKPCSDLSWGESSLASPGTRPGESCTYTTHTHHKASGLFGASLPPAPPPHPWPWEEASGAPAELEGKYKSSRHVSVASAEFEAGGGEALCLLSEVLSHSVGSIARGGGGDAPPQRIHRGFLEAQGLGGSG